MKWEKIDHNMYRARVINGWLVKYELDVMTPMHTGYPQPEMMTGYEWRISMTFVPDINHEWELEKEERT